MARGSREVDHVGDHVLLAGMAAGDEHMAVAFVRRFQRTVFGIALAVIGEDARLAEDVAQQAFERAWRHAGLYDPRRWWLVLLVFAIVGVCRRNGKHGDRENERCSVSYVKQNKSSCTQRIYHAAITAGLDRHEFMMNTTTPSRIAHKMERITPPSARNAAPLVAEESGLATNATSAAISSGPAIMGSMSGPTRRFRCPRPARRSPGPAAT